MFTETAANTAEETHVLGDTTDTRPAVTLEPVLVLGTASLQQRLLQTSATGDDADHATGSGQERLLGAGRETHTGLALLRVVRHNGAVRAGGTGEGGAVTSLVLEVAHDGTFGEVADGEDVASVQGSW
jgi:hypothetical protein